MKLPLKNLSRSPHSYVSIEGIIGAGKSTLLSNLKGFINKIPEPVAQYRRYFSRTKDHLFDFDAQPRIRVDPLIEMYRDPIGNGPMAQLHILQEGKRYYRDRLIESDCQFNVSERSLLSPGPFIWAKLHAGEISEFTASKLKDVHSDIISRYEKYLPRYVLYLQTDPEVAFQRIQTRLDDCSTLIKREYIAAVHEGHELVFNRQDPKTRFPHIRIVNTTNLTETQVKEQAYQFFDDIANNALVRSSGVFCFPQQDASPPPEEKPLSDALEMEEGEIGET